MLLAVKHQAKAETGFDSRANYNLQVFIYTITNDVCIGKGSSQPVLWNSAVQLVSCERFSRVGL